MQPSHSDTAKKQLPDFEDVRAGLIDMLQSLTNASVLQSGKQQDRHQCTRTVTIAYAAGPTKRPDGSVVVGKPHRLCVTWMEVM